MLRFRPEQYLLLGMMPDCQASLEAQTKLFNYAVNPHWMLNPGVLIAALGITLLEMAEASAVGITLYGDSGRKSAFVAVALGALLVFLVTGTAGGIIEMFPILYVRLVSATLLLYFGLRLIRSSRRSMKFQRFGNTGKKKESEAERGVLSTGFSVGVVEAFEAAIVLVALFPEGYYSTLTGLIAGVLIVSFAAYALKSQVRKVKQANMKVVVSALLLSFSTFWYVESFRPVDDILLIPMFLVYALFVYFVATFGLGKKSGTSA